MKASAKRLANDTDYMIVIGIGGSYLGARAVIEAVGDDPGRVLYAGENISAHYINKLKSIVKDKRIAINVVSKSGTTTEPAIAFRIMRELIDPKVAKQHIVATTDANKGALLELARKEGYETYVVPDDIGGRYSVLSAVGLFPISYAGIDIDELISGAADCAELCKNADPFANPAYFYACARNVLYHQGYAIELLASFEPRLHYLAEWWKQLFGESEGKENMAAFPASVDFTTDLHSMGQYIQAGRRFMTRDVPDYRGRRAIAEVPEDPDDADGLNYLAGSEVSFVNTKAYEATARAHREGGVPNMTIALEKLTPYSMGALIYFFEVACAVSGLMLGVNPFDQPGVEDYKRHMFELLGKPGYKASTGIVKPEYVKF